jgi:methylthioribulose 1-phosphate dehydratase/enolase-phosphatase E1
MDSRHSASQAQGTVWATNPQEQAAAVRALIAQLCETFYKAGWATGTGGGVCIRTRGNHANHANHGSTSSKVAPWRVFVAPSGIQKEDMIGNDIFELDMDRNVVVPPKTPGLRQSACTPLWYTVFKHRPTAACVIHTHSMSAQLATLLGQQDAHVLRITHLEMLKGVGNHSYDDVLEIPIIDNRPTEDLLAAQLEAAIVKYPKTNAVLVRRHGLYVWGDSWEQAKTQCESFDYLFDCCIQMKSMGLDASEKPVAGTYRVTDETSGTPTPTANDTSPPTKRQKTSTGFHGTTAVDNAADCASNSVPILPRDAKVLVLDVEGCTTAISFVKETMFPYVLEHLDDYLESTVAAEQMVDLCRDLAQEVNAHGGTSDPAVTDETYQDAAAMVYYLMARDVKSAALKGLQGKMWKAGFESGEMKGHVYSDLNTMLEWMHSKGVKVYIYSSGSVQAQQLLFGHSVAGDLLPMLAGHFDISTAGNKKESMSYSKIAAAIGVEPAEVVFVSDAEAELVAATEAGIGWPIMSIRPGNVPLTTIGKDFPAVYSLLQLCGEN